MFLYRYSGNEKCDTEGNKLKIRNRIHNGSMLKQYINKEPCLRRHLLRFQVITEGYEVCISFGGKWVLRADVRCIRKLSFSSSSNNKSIGVTF